MPGTQLTVTLSPQGGAADAQTVVRALENAFGAPDEVPADDRATVHTATFAADPEGRAPRRTEGAHAGGDRLSAPVAVTVQGTPDAVRRASETLAGAFTAHDQGAASGDQEQERQLLLEP
jgi:hypothetical protein